MCGPAASGDRRSRIPSLVEELLELVEAALAAEGPAHALGGVEHGCRLGDGEVEAGDGVHQIAGLVIDEKRAALAAAAIELLGDQEELVHRIDRDSGAAAQLVGVTGAGKLHRGDAAL